MGVAEPGAVAEGNHPPEGTGAGSTRADVDGDGAADTDTSTDADTNTNGGPPTEQAPGRRRAWLITTVRRAPMIFGLAGVAVAQPVLDLFGNAPEFFVASRISGLSLVWFALVVVVVPGAAAVAVIGLAELVHPRFGTVVHTAGIGGFGFLFGLVLANHLGVHGLLTSMVGALGLAALVAWLERRFEQVRRLLSYVALGNLVFLGTFLVSSPASDLLVTSDTAEAAGQAWVTAPPPRGPVVVLVLDELPVTTLMNPDGSINRERYPNFGRLADRSTWFRNASSHAPMTHQAMPSLLTGTLPRQGALPTFEDHPQNFFTMFGDTYPVNGYESVTHLCPGNACAVSSRGSLVTAFKDAAVVFGHQTLPTDLRERLPAVDHSWGNFTGSGRAGVPDPSSPDAAITEDDPYGRWHAMDLADTSARNQIRILDQVVAEIDDTPALHLAHVAVPHYPWVLAPEGELTQTLQLDRNPPDPDHELLVEQAYQLQSLQIAAVDRSVGAFMDRLEAQGVWDDALVVVTSDQGRAMLPPPNFGRVLTDRTREEMLRVPLFIKAPGQTAGEVRDDVAQLVDIMPSILDLLAAESDHDFDGHSLFDGSPAEVAPRVDRDVEAAFAVAARNAALFPQGDAGWLGLAAVGEQADLVGTSVDDHRVGTASRWQVSFADQDVFADLPAEGNRWPRLLQATVSGDAGRPPDLVVAIDGQLAGILSGYDHDGDVWTMTGVTAPLFHEGANEVVAYEVERTGDETSNDEAGDAGHVVLHPLDSP